MAKGNRVVFEEPRYFLDFKIESGATIKDWHWKWDKWDSSFLQKLCQLEIEVLI